MKSMTERLKENIKKEAMKKTAQDKKQEMLKRIEGLDKDYGKINYEYYDDNELKQIVEEMEKIVVLGGEIHGNEVIVKEECKDWEKLEKYAEDEERIIQRGVSQYGLALSYHDNLDDLKFFGTLEECENAIKDIEERYGEKVVEIWKFAPYDGYVEEVIEL